MPDWQQLGIYIAETRRRRGLRRAELARRLGVSPTFLLRVERGERGISDLSLLERTASALGLDAEERIELYLAAVTAPPELQSLLLRTELAALLRGILELRGTAIEDLAFKQAETLGALFIAMAGVLRQR